jgi:hypothetical protein
MHTSTGRAMNVGCEPKSTDAILCTNVGFLPTASESGPDELS